MIPGGGGFLFVTRLAITQTTLTTAANDDSTDATSYSTGSFTPSANKLVIMAVQSSKLTLPDIPTVTGNNLTWVSIATISVTDTIRLTLFRAMGSAPSAGAATIDFAGNTQTSCAWSITEFTNTDQTGTNGSGAIVQSATNTATGAPISSPFIVTLSAFANPLNATYVAAAGDIDTSGLNADTGWTQIQNFGPAASPTRGGSSSWKNSSDTTAEVAVGGTVANVAGIAIEIKSVY